MSAVPSIERVVETRDASATRALGAALARRARPGDVVCLVGPLGAGKTQLAKGFGQGLGVAETVSSPSFVLVAEYRGRVPFFHVDLFRLSDVREALESGVLDERRASGVTVIEWADRLGPALPADRLDVRIEGAGDEPRRISIRPTGARHRHYLEAA